MRILLTGANGLIGSAVLARLRSEANDVAAVVRRSSPNITGLATTIIRMDISRATSPEAWLPHLDGIDAVVNCAGVLQDAPGDSTTAVHASGILALFAACARVGVRRVVHLSAIGVDREAPTPFSRTKLEGDQALIALNLDWVILRPSVVVGRAAYGGSALFRGLAALPIVPVMPGTAPLQVVQLDDVVRTITFFVKPDTPSRIVLELAGPERLSMTEVVRAYRRWFGWPAATRVAVPQWLAGLAYRSGDAIALLGWRPPVRTTARLEMVRGAIGDPRPWTKTTGISPASLDEALATELPSIQERWFARLYFVKPVVLAVLSLFWTITGIISLGPGYKTGVLWMDQGGAGQLSEISVVLGGLADIVIGLGIAVRDTAKRALQAAIALTLVYVVMGTLLVPRLWVDPLGPMLKIWPILVLNFVALAILDDR
ncbi:MAG: SDR family oxidoreductase [Hyphomicrobiales bacterium]